MKTTRQKHQTEILVPSRNYPKSVLVLNFRLPRAAALALLAGLPVTARAQDKSTEFIEPSTFDKLWSYATLYKDDTDPILQEFKLRGRYQGHYWDVDADQGSQSNWEDRRSRFGFDAKLFDKKIEARVDFQSNDGFDDFYDGLVDAYLRWKPKSWLSITAGKTKPLIAQYDWLESTNTQPTYDIIPKTLQLVGRYSYANSDGPLGISGQSRYERKVATNKGLGDAYHSFYGGAQYFIYGDKLKLMAGIEWATVENSQGDSYDGYTLLSGIRFSF
ncbi:hypothetical protein HQ447_17855 [bacterium]|nr:hypothetical protein [bacterium]